MKSDEDIMEILEAYDLTESFRGAGEPAGCAPHTVAHWVEAREAGLLRATPARRPQLIDEHLGKPLQPSLVPYILEPCCESSIETWASCLFTLSVDGEQRRFKGASFTLLWAFIFAIQNVPRSRRRGSLSRW